MKGQAGIEFIAVFSLVMAFFVIMQVYIANQSFFNSQSQISANAVSITKQISSQIQVYAGSNGLTGQLILPSYLDRGQTNYQMYVSNSSVELIWQFQGVNHTAIQSISINSIVNSSGSSSFFLQSGNTYQISSNSSQVLIS